MFYKPIVAQKQQKLHVRNYKHEHMR